MQHYGKGPSTGLDQTALGKIQTGLTTDDLVMSTEDKAVLRTLAERVGAIAASQEMAETRRRWRAHNNLRPGRPLVFCDPENGWNEIITEAQMACSGKLSRRWEMDLRKEIFWGEEMGDDKPVEPFFDIPYTTAPEDWGLETVFRRSGMADGSQSWEGPVQDYECDLLKLQTPPIEIDWETTNGCLAIAHDLFDGILESRLKGTWWWSLGITLPAVMLRGLTNMFMDFVEQPDNLKALFALISKAHLARLDYLQARNLLSVNDDGTYVGSGGFGFTDALPKVNGEVHCQNMWGFAESQETVSVSPEMYAEFVFPYEQPILERFGINCYGCCEPLHARWETVRQHHGLRRVSVSPWADVNKMAAQLSDRYVFSYKPAPADLALPTLDEARLRSSLRQVLEATRDCRVELIMKDNHTLGGHSEHAPRWCRMAKEEIERMDR